MVTLFDIFFHNSTHEAQGSIVVELVAEAVPNTLLAFTSRGADLTCGAAGDAMAMVFVPKIGRIQVSFGKCFNIHPYESLKSKREIPNQKQTKRPKLGPIIPPKKT